MTYYLIDTSAIIHYYIPSDKTSKIQTIVDKKKNGFAFLFIPNFCIAEAFNTFAKYRYRYATTKPTKAISEDDYEKCTTKFREHIHEGNLLYHYELNRYHMLNSNLVAPFDHQIDLQREARDGSGKKEDWCLSTFDILFIAMGIELVRIVEKKNLHLITCDTRINHICHLLEGLSMEDRCKHGIPNHVVFPTCCLLK
ncbi:MAG: hypothetical protein V2A65_08120 [Candidatus Omnitrophota bacterium]